MFPSLCLSQFSKKILFSTIIPSHLSHLVPLRILFSFDTQREFVELIAMDGLTLETRDLHVIKLEKYGA
jgi:hypothetical protein